MAQEPIDWRDPQFMEKLNTYINETGINPLTGEPATDNATDNGKFVAKYYTPVKAGSKGFAKYIDDAAKILKAAKSTKLIGAVAKLLNNPFIKKLGSKVTGPWGSIAVNVGLEAFENYHDPSDGSYHSVGKSIVGGTVDAVKNASLFDSVMIGAEFGMAGGVHGMVVGAISGAIFYIGKSIVNWVAPDWDKHAKNFLYDAYDSVANSEIGKAVTNEISRVKTSAGEAINKVETATKKAVSDGARIVKNLWNDATKLIMPKANAASLGWFG